MEQFKLFGHEKSFKLTKYTSPEGSLGVRKKSQKKFRSRDEYYHSEAWEIKRAFVLHRAKGRCDKCGSKGPLQVHHITYDRLYDESPEDLEALCSRCHKRADKQREYNNQYRSALNTYLDKKYGEGCDYFEGCEEEFEAWLESKDQNY